jgi:hypothetical protein
MNKKKDLLDLVIKHVFMKMKRRGPKPGKCPDEETLAAFCEGSLAQKEMERIEEHLTLCETCTESLIAFSEAEGSRPTAKEARLRAKDLMKPVEKWTLRERISSWLPVSRPVPITVAAAVVLAAIILGIYTMYTPHRPSPEMPPAAKLGLIARIPAGVVTRGAPHQYTEVQIPDGGVLHTGDMFRIHVELQEEAYVYLLALDSQGNLARLFPEKDFPVKVRPHETRFFPSGRGWLRLDDKTGEEKLVLLISTGTIEGFNKKIEELKRLGIDKIDKIFSEARVQILTFRHD